MVLAVASTPNRRYGVALAIVAARELPGPIASRSVRLRTEPSAETFGSAGLPAVEDAAGRHYPRDTQMPDRARVRCAAFTMSGQEGAGRKAPSGESSPIWTRRPTRRLGRLTLS